MYSLKNASTLQTIRGYFSCRATPEEDDSGHLTVVEEGSGRMI